MIRRLVFLLACCALPAFAVVINVPGDYPTIQQGIDAAVSGDIVMVAPGTYPEEITLKAGVVVRGAGEGRSTIDGGGNPGDVVRAIGSGIDRTARLEGFTVTGALNGGGLPGGAGVFCNSGARPTISNCRLTGNDCGLATWNNSNPLVTNCVVASNVYDGIDISSPATVVNNTIHHNRIGVSDGGGYGPTVMNNIITWNTMYGVYGPSGGTRPACTYNDAWGNATDYYQCTPGTGSIYYDPLYVDTTTADFHLQPGSPAIDSGNPDPQYNDPDGTRNDMGAYGGPDAPATGSPQLLFVSPRPNVHDAPTGSSLLAGFDMDMDRNTFNNRTVMMRGLWTGAGTGTVSYDSATRQVILSPIGQLRHGEPVLAGLSSGITSLAGDSFAGFAWQFRTAVRLGSGTFADTAAGPAGGSPVRIYTADFNCDDRLDIAVVNVYSNCITVRLGNGDGTFSPAINTGTNVGPQSLACVDFNNDDLLDLAVVTGDGESLDIFTGNGDGTFERETSYLCVQSAYDIACADFNLDGNLDLAVLLTYGSYLQLFLGEGNGRFRPQPLLSIPGEPYSLAVCDINGDGRPDLATANCNPNGLGLLAGNGDGTFDSSWTGTIADRPVWVRTGDFNEDGLTDFAVTCRYSGTICTWTGDGNGGAAGPQVWPAPGQPEQLAVNDFNADGHLDLAVTCDDSQTVNILLGHGDNTFETSQVLRVAGALPLTDGDFDNDGDIDLVVAGYDQDELHLLRNQYELRVLATVPAQYALAAPETASVQAQFNQALQPSSVDSASFVVRGSQSGLHRGPIDFDPTATAATLDPRRDFLPGEVITCDLTGRIAAATGVRLAGFAWEFSSLVPPCSSGAFAAPNAFPAGAEPRGLWCADFDADADVDVAVTSNSPAAVALLQNDGAGHLAAPAYCPVAGDPIALFGADMDSDGDIDICCLHNEPGSSHLEILKNDGNAVFSVLASYTPAVLGERVAGADLDADGDVDIVVSDGWGSQNNVLVMVNDGTGHLAAGAILSAGAFARGLTLADVDHDGDIDICCLAQGDNNLTLFRNDGTGRFARPEQFPAGSSPDAVTAFDFNGDGSVDLAVCGYGSTDARVLVNDGTGRFLAPVSYPIGVAARALTAGDFDGDQDVDLAVAGAADSCAVLLNQGDATFGQGHRYQAGSGQWSVSCADMDSDRALDLAVSNYSSNSVSILPAAPLGIAGSAPAQPQPATLAAWPSPARGPVEFALPRLLVGAALQIRDVQGRLVRALSASPSVERLVWDRTDWCGRPVSAGIYMARLVPAETNQAVKLLVVR